MKFKFKYEIPVFIFFFIVRLIFFIKQLFIWLCWDDGDLSLPFGLALGSPIFPSGCEGKMGVVLESPQGRRDLT